jgi:hypothetical protein
MPKTNAVEVLRAAARNLERREFVAPMNGAATLHYPCWHVCDARGKNVEDWPTDNIGSDFLHVYTGARGRAGSRAFIHGIDGCLANPDNCILALCFAAAVIEAGGL